MPLSPVAILCSPMSKALRTKERAPAAPEFADESAPDSSALPRRAEEITGVFLFLLAVFATLSLVSFDPGDTAAVAPRNESVHNLCGPAGAACAERGLRFFGYAVWVLTAAAYWAGARLLARRGFRPGWSRAGGLALVVLAAATLAARLQGAHFTDVTMPSPGGLTGALLAGLLGARLGTAGTLLCCAFGLLAGLALAGEVSLVQFLRARLAALWNPADVEGVVRFRASERLAAAVTGGALAVDEARDVFIPKAEKDGPAAAAAIVVPPETAPAAGNAAAIASAEASAPRRKKRPEPPPAPAPPPPAPIAWVLPEATLLDEPRPVDLSRLEKGFATVARDLEQSLANFRIEAKVLGFQRGPVLTMYELQLAPGVKLQQVVKLADDLAMGLRVERVRIIAPIPGRSTVGIEVPNKVREPVVLRELLDHPGFREKKFQIPLLIGKDAVGAHVVEDLGRMPHVLVAGTTGSGKSSAVNALILSVLMLRKPDDVRLILIDPKMVELSVYNDIPHLLMPVVTEMKRAPLVLDWAVQEMETRYALLSRVGFKHCKDFNKLATGRRETLFAEREVPDELRRDHMPYVVIVVDEYADLMCVAEKEVEESIVRIAQKARAVGIHLVLATQRPTVDVVTGLIKANMPTRMALRVMARTESRVILDSEGAQALLGYGDMLYKGPTAMAPIRVQSCFASEGEIDRVVRFWKEQGPPQYMVENLAHLAARTAGPRDDALDPASDELFVPAADLLVQERRGSASLLQRAFGVGYTRASRLIDMMRAEGIIGEHKGSQASEVLITADDWPARRGKYTGGEYVAPAGTAAAADAWEDETDDETDDDAPLDDESDDDDAGGGDADRA